MATFRKYKTKKGMLWRYQILVGTDTVTGKRKYKTKGGFYTKKEAKLAADEVEKKINNPNFLDNENITFGEVYERWIANYKLTVKESSFYIIEIQYKSKILPILGNKKINQITTIECQDLVNYWYSIPLKNYKVIFNLVTRIFKYAKQLKIVANGSHVISYYS